MLNGPIDQVLYVQRYAKLHRGGEVLRITRVLSDR